MGKKSSAGGLPRRWQGWMQVQCQREACWANRPCRALYLLNLHFWNIVFQVILKDHLERQMTTVVILMSSSFHRSSISLQQKLTCLSRCWSVTSIHYEFFHFCWTTKIGANVILRKVSSNKRKKTAHLVLLHKNYISMVDNSITWCHHLFDAPFLSF